MNTSTCDCCGKEITPATAVPVGQQRKSRIVVGEKNLGFYFEFRLVAFEGSHPDLCAPCLFNALANPAPEPPAPLLPAPAEKA